MHHFLHQICIALPTHLHLHLLSNKAEKWKKKERGKTNIRSRKTLGGVKVFASENLVTIEDL